MDITGSSGNPTADEANIKAKFNWNQTPRVLANQTRPTKELGWSFKGECNISSNFGGKVKRFLKRLCLADPYVKVYLVCDGRRLKKRKTTTKKSTLNPVFNEAIIFDIPPENVEQVSLSIMVMDYDR